MKKIVVYYILISLFIGCKTSRYTIINDPKKDYFEVKRGDMFEIQFVTNTSMGLSWVLTNEASVSVVEPKESRYVSTAPENMVGAASERYWSFRAVKKGTDTLHFDYCRGQDPSTSVKSRKVVVKVR